MKTEVKLFNAGEDFDFESHAVLMKNGFQENFATAGMANSFMTPAWYKWKYRGPFGPARVAALFEQGKMVAANSAIQYVLQNGDSNCRAWQSTDSVTDRGHRGKGHFLTCLNALKDSMDKDDVFFGYPNDQSRHGFEKVGWKVIAEYRAALSIQTPLIYILDREEEANWERVGSFASYQKKLNQFSQKLCTYWTGSHLQLNAEYLDWRYFKYPENIYYSYVLWNQNKEDIDGLLVCRKFTYKFLQFILIMEIHGTSEKNIRRVLAKSRRLCREFKTILTLNLNTAVSRTDAMRCQFFPVPSRLLPKRQFLMAQAPALIGQQSLFDQDWRSQLGDWDGF